MTVLKKAQRTKVQKEKNKIIAKELGITVSALEKAKIKANSQSEKMVIKFSEENKKKAEPEAAPKKPAAKEKSATKGKSKSKAKKTKPKKR